MYSGSKSGVSCAPAFDLLWLEDVAPPSPSSSSTASSGSAASAPAPDAVMLLPSGGGSENTGVKNQIQVLRVQTPPDDAAPFVAFAGFETDGPAKSGSGICSSGNTTTLLDGTHLLCTLIDDRCLLTSIAPGGKSSSGSSSSSSSSSNNKRPAPLPASGLLFTRLADFRADFPAPSPSPTGEGDGGRPQAGVGSCCFATVRRSAGAGPRVAEVLFTGGNDGLIRAWQVLPQLQVGGAEDSATAATAKGSAYRFPLIGVLGGHSAAVLRVTAHPDLGWLASASADGTFALWDMSAIVLHDQGQREQGQGQSGEADPSTAPPSIKPILQLSCISAATTAAASKGKGKGRSARQSVDVQFAQGGDAPPQPQPAAAAAAGSSSSSSCCFVYTLSSVAGSAAQLTKWRVAADSLAVKRELAQDSKESTEAERKSTQQPQQPAVVVVAAAETTLDVSPLPAKRLAVSATGLFLAVGDSDGNVFVHNALTMRKYGKYKCHDFAVTGLAFAPDSVAASLDVPAVLNSVSFDNRVSIIPLGGASKVLQTVGTVLLSLIVLLLSLLTLALLAGFFVQPVSIA